MSLLHMAAILHPIQCLASDSGGPTGITYFACKSELFQVDGDKGRILGQWRSESESWISLLQICPGSARVAAATSDDKTVHIFSANGLHLESQSVMPKRPSAISFSPDGTILYVADKFGDVYALSTKPESEQRIENAPRAPRKQKLNATELTVHSQRNLIAMQNQAKVAAEAADKRKGEQRDTPKADSVYDGEPEIGHVSMLTDILATRMSSQIAENNQHVVITADRDEHIRISRGVPQTQVIEGFCLGHASFVNKLCLLTDNFLVSGGGDDSLFVWKLPGYDLVQTLPLKELVDHGRHGLSGTGESVTIAVTQLMVVDKQDSGVRLLCACEGIATLQEFSLRLDGAGGLLRCSSARLLHLDGNPLALTSSSGRVIVSIDNVNQPGLRRQRRADIVPRLHYIGDSASADAFLTAANTLGQSLSDDSTESLNGLMYSAENIRKRSNEDS